ncbi:hypothetical protein [Sphaerothrix gracilis]|uniref:hypothetical protein n=1 Tax=Sphaerothrix gracilis TaxID=3151835 RepID=UPI0031FE335D
MATNDQNPGGTEKSKELERKGREVREGEQWQQPHKGKSITIALLIATSLAVPLQKPALADDGRPDDLNNPCPIYVPGRGCVPSWVVL